MSIVIKYAGETGAKLGIACQRPGCRAEQDVDLVVLKGLEAVAGIEAQEFDGVPVSEYGGGERGTELDIEAAPRTPGVNFAEACGMVCDTADNLAPGPHRIQNVDRRAHRLGG